MAERLDSILKKGIIESSTHYETRQREKLGPIGRFLEDSIHGQPLSWKNSLTRKVIAKYYSRKPLYSREFIETYNVVQEQLGKDARQKNKEGKNEGFLYV